MPYERMARNLNQSIFALFLSFGFSAILIAIFTMKALILAIFEIPLVFLVALITITECIYSYREEVSFDTTMKMMGPLFKSILISIPVVLLYSAIILILEQTVTIFKNALEPLFDQIIQSLSPIAAIPIIFFVPIFIMMFSSPLLFFIYGKVHILLFSSPRERRKEEKEKKIQMDEQKFQKELFRVMDELDQQSVQLQQYFLELQGIDERIEEVSNHESYKGLNSRLTMMNDYVTSLGLKAETKEEKKIASTDEVKRKLEEIDNQKRTILDIIEQNLKKLHKKKGMYEKEEEEEEDYVSEDKGEITSKDETLEETEEKEDINPEGIIQEEKKESEDINMDNNTEKGKNSED
ncbi:MAG: hypothetical protein ACTSX6_05630 [Candidatus Heimdallarchaeaceae archaeon]